MIESLYAQQIAAHRHWLHVRLGMLKAGIQDGDHSIWASLWFEVRLEAEIEILRIREEMREARKVTYA